MCKFSTVIVNFGIDNIADGVLHWVLSGPARVPLYKFIERL